MTENIKWLGHSSFLIEDEKRLYIDPWKLKTCEPADIILISHPHFDHFSISDIRKIQKPCTTFITTDDCSKLVEGTIEILKPGEEIKIGNIRIKGFPAYNINKDFHPRENNWLGFIITIGKKQIYYAGDTDAIPEMKFLENIDIALMPVIGTYVMTAREAADSANMFKPDIAIPYHWGDIVGKREDAEEFIQLFTAGKGIILDITC